MASTIMITGATGKLGTALTKHFVGLGKVVIGTGRSEESLQALKQMCQAEVGEFIGIAVDFSIDGALASVGDQLSKLGLRPDCLVNNARCIEYLKIQDDGRVSRENFCNEYLIDVVVPYELTMLLASQDKCNLRNVINIGSQYGVVAANPQLYDQPSRQSPIHYGVAKAALIHLTKELAVRLADQDIRVNCIAFGGVEGRVDDAFKERYAKLCPIGRMLLEEEIVGPVQMLLTHGSAAITGQTIIADGGWSLW